MTDLPLDSLEIPADALPPKAHAFARELAHRGYAVVGVSYTPESSGDARITLQRAQTRIRLARDHDRMVVEVSGVGWREWFEPLDWHHFLTAAAPPSVAGFDAELPFLREDLAKIEAAIPGIDIAALARLRKISANRVGAFRAPLVS